ncbi:MAG: N-acetylglucosamine-specific PTS transporter subunit IIBC [Steroidobacteraceae bacterium]|jgi:PTS system N-acetylglucosamine-specific IIC component
MSTRFSGLQQLGRALMLPIAVLPIAGMLLRLGQPDLLGWPVMAAAGDAIFSNLGLLFAVGVAVGLARENHGAAGLAALVCYLVTTRGIETLMAVPPAVTAGLHGDALALALSNFKTHELTKLSVPVGLLSGITAGIAYNRFSNITLPSYLAFFGGRRFVAILTGLAGVFLALLIGTFWPFLERGMDAASLAIMGAGSVGLFIYGVLNRLLIVTGLHHIINSYAWFILGDYHGVTGDLNRFRAGDPSAGAFMSGFFPVMMFGLPAACLAMYHAADPKRRVVVGGLLMSLALTSFLTGITEPIEFTFMFLAPLLFAVHAIATGMAMVIMHVLGVHLGFGFSAGFFDYVLYFNRAQRPLMLIPVGLVYSLLYYTVFRFCIVRFNLATPGRETDPAAVARLSAAPAGGRAGAFIAALGGAANLTEVEACTTRLRLVVANSEAIDTAALKQLGAMGVLRSSTTELQVVLGPQADQIAGEIREALRAAPIVSAPAHDAAALLSALGGAGNVVGLVAAPGRILVTVAEDERINAAALIGPGVRAVARPGAKHVHVLLAGLVEDMAEQLRALIARG